MSVFEIRFKENFMKLTKTQMHDESNASQYFMTKDWIYSDGSLILNMFPSFHHAWSYTYKEDDISIFNTISLM